MAQSTEISYAPGDGGTAGRRNIQSVLRDCPEKLQVRLWDGEVFRFGPAPSDAVLVFRDPALLRELVLTSDPLRLSEGYFLDRLDIEGDIYAVLRLKEHLQELKFTLAERFALMIAALRLDSAPRTGGLEPIPRRRWYDRILLAHSRRRDRRAVRMHYDVSNEFYRLWLDQQMVYSCAYFENPDNDLDQAQRNKMDYICRKLRLKPGEYLLDIGCGWGGLVRWAARHYGARATGITLSRQQFDYARRWIADDHLADRVDIRCMDYRDLDGEAAFDKIVSVGMFEHVGLKNLPLYFNCVGRLLKPGGLFLNHGITHSGEGWRDSVGTRFINRYIFPDGELDCVSNIQRVMERCGFELLDVEALRPHYARTLRNWVKRLEGRRREALEYVSETVYRIWRLYMAACALEFEKGGVGVYQVLAGRRGVKGFALPPTRRDLYVESSDSRHHVGSSEKPV
jgi:cyclopropane-fatty-acyl-phospholipid synthase